jgi:hypothetical protein
MRGTGPEAVWSVYSPDIVRQLDHFRARGYTIKIQLLLGHEGVGGNERADGLAKAAAEEASRLTPGLQLVAMSRQNLRELAAHALSAQWAVNPHGKHARRILSRNQPRQCLTYTRDSIERGAPRSYRCKQARLLYRDTWEPLRPPKRLYVPATMIYGPSNTC